MSPGVLIGVSLWRLLIVAFAFIGFGAMVGEYGWESAAPGLSQQASLLVGVVYTGLLCYPLFTGGKAHEPHSPWLRGAMTVLLLLVAVTFLTIMGGSLDETWSLFEHLLTPLVVLIDWAVVGRNQAGVKWWHPLTWIVFPVAYLVYYLAADVGLYRGFLDPDSSGFAGTILGFLAAVIAAGYMLYGVAKLKTAAATGTQAPAGLGHPSYAQAPQYPQGPYPRQQAGYPPQQASYQQQPPYGQQSAPPGSHPAPSGLSAPSAPGWSPAPGSTAGPGGAGRPGAPGGPGAAGGHGGQPPGSQAPGQGSHGPSRG